MPRSLRQAGVIEVKGPELPPGRPTQGSGAVMGRRGGYQAVHRTALYTVHCTPVLWPALQEVEAAARLSLLSTAGGPPAGQLQWAALVGTDDVNNLQA